MSESLPRESDNPHSAPPVSDTLSTMRPSLPKRRSPWAPMMLIVLLLIVGVVGLAILKKTSRRPRPQPTGISQSPGTEPATGDVCSKGETIPCTQLGASFTGGTAHCRDDQTGYDVSTCNTSGKAEMVKPAERDDKQWAKARCNDGSSFGFDVKLASSTTTDWVIFLEGGAFCDDQANSCAERGKKLSSTPPEDDRAVTQIKPEGIFSPNRNINPTFYNANHVFARYCSSDGWSGATDTKRPTVADRGGWYFSGRRNVAAMIEALSERYGLDDGNSQTKVLFSGSSAGGIGVEVNADNVAALLPQTAGRGKLLLLDDGGFIPDFDDPQYRPGDFDGPLRELIAKDHPFWASQLNPLCEQANSQNPGRCFLSKVVYPFITDPKPTGLGLPLLIQYSSIDKFAIGLHGIESQVADKEGLTHFRETALSDLEIAEWLFSGGEEPYHTILTSPTGWRYGPSGKTFQEVVTRFWEGKPAERVIFGNP